MKGAIFDMDGTLLDSMQVWVHVGEQYLRNRGIEPEEGLGDVLFPMSMRDRRRTSRGRSRRRQRCR